VLLAKQPIIIKRSNSLNISNAIGYADSRSIGWNPAPPLKDVVGGILVIHLK
jgi:hypothetical protein